MICVRAHHVIVDEDGKHTCQVCGATGDAPPVLPCLGPRILLNGWPVEPGSVGYELVRAYNIAQAERDKAWAALERVRALGESWVGFDDSHHYGDALLQTIEAWDCEWCPGGRMDNPNPGIWVHRHDTAEERAWRDSPGPQADLRAAQARRRAAEVERGRA